MMARIADMSWSKKRGRGAAEIALDDGTVLQLDAEIAVRFQLKRGMEVSAALAETIRSENAMLEARQRLVRHLAMRRKTAQEAHTYLTRLGFTEEAAAAAVEHARALGMIDDQEYARTYARSQQRGARKGPRAIRYELEQRGVDRPTADEAVAPGRERETQLANARHAAERKAAALAREAPAKARAKLMQFLLRRGYEGDIAAEVARELLDGAGEPDE
jgi:regulatory protein